MSYELPDVQAEFRKARGIRDQAANICWIIEKPKEFQKTSTSSLLITPKPWTVWIITDWKILQEMEIPDHLTRFLRNLYAGQEATVRSGHGTTDWFQIGKGVYQGCHPAYLTYMQSSSCEMLCWMKLKMESSCQEKC